MVDKLPGDYIAGFVDGEGCFALKFRRDVRHERKNKPVYFYWDIEFAIGLRGDDREILERIKGTLGCGKISMDKRGTAQYSVDDIDDLSSKIVPFFEKYQLRAKKKLDFDLWKEALILLSKNKGLKTGISTTDNPRGSRKTIWSHEDLQRLVIIQEKMKQIKGKRPEWRWFSRVIEHIREESH